MNDSSANSLGKSWRFFLCLALLAGAALRLSFPGDIEYKGDERYMFEAAQSIDRYGVWPHLGMISGVGVANPGLSVWVFGVLYQLIHPVTPPDLSRGVEILNIAALLLLAFFSLRIIQEAERPAWLWATVLAAVNPFAVLFHRKIWAQDTLPLFCVLFWIAWHYRGKRLGAFGWGLIGICLGQIHMSGFFLAGGVFLWTVYRERRLQWVSWLAGSLAGAVPLLPWLQYMAAKPRGGFDWTSLKWILYPKYWFYWVTDSLGMGLNYSLKTHEFMDLMRYPLIGGVGTYLVGILHVLVIAIGILIVLSAKKGGRLSWGMGDSTDTGMALASVFVVAGILITLSCAQVMRHYLIVTFPLEWVWLSRLGLLDRRWGQRYLLAIWVTQLVTSICFLTYIHVNHGDPLGDYGVTYDFQGK
ncbi:MAG TPA: hypothetical protein VMV05_02080 [bacterium]|nr:hypothetical protein [bacterium]